MHLFGTLGLLAFFIGFVISLILAFQKFAYQQYHMTDRPIFYIGLVSMIIGMQLFSAGFLAELISRSSHDRNNYQVEKCSDGDGFTLFISVALKTPR